MEILLAKTAGFCFGVNRAVKIAEQLAGKENVYTLGPLIHNKDEVDRLGRMGVGVYDGVHQVQRGDTVIIRSHGIAKAEEDILREKGAEIVDATCPFVKKNS